MAKAPKLKVYRTPIGFHDAYVAASSQRAALEAWGADANLFARGVAEQVDDPVLTKEPLAKPGEIIRRLRETPDEEPAPAKTRRSEAAPKPPAKPKAKPKPRPSREALDAAEQALSDAEARHDAELKALTEKLTELERQRRALEKAQATEQEKLEAARGTAASAYEKALDRWRG